MTLRTFSELSQTGQDIGTRFKALAGDKRSQGFLDFASELQFWLAECVEHGRFLPPGSADRRALQGQVDYWTSRLLQAGYRLPKVDQLADFDPTAGRPLGNELFPYYGLLAVTEADTQHFFGRDKQIAEYVAHLESHAALMIQSESGGGKSSVAMAGVIPELRRRHPDDWLVTPRITPGAHPQSALNEALATVLGPSTAAGADVPTIINALGRRDLLIFIDQLEELLTVCTNEPQQAAFCALLAALANSRRVRLLATLRIDHYDRLSSSQACQPLFKILTVDNSMMTLPPMSFEQIRSVILKPAQAVGLRYVPAKLVDDLANQTANLVGGLPRLQFALQRLWELRPKNDQGESLDLINQESYNKLPNVSDALSTVAQEIFESFPESRSACERLMLELTVLDDQLETPLRRRRFELELLAVLEGAKLATEEQVRDLMNRFVNQRLLVRTGEGDVRQIEVAHESLFRYWDQFNTWIKSTKTRVRLKDIRQIARDAQQWENRAFSPDYLMLKGLPLENARSYCDDNWFDTASRRYYEACLKAVKHQKRVRTLLSVALIATILVVLIALGFLLSVYNINKVNEQSAKKYSAAANMYLALLPPMLEPLEAIDVAYNIEKTSQGNYIVPLAQAMDLMTAGQMISKRDAGADFSPSGRALIQLVRINKENLTVRIIPIEADGTFWEKPVTIAIVEDASSQLAALDVGPPIATNADTRLIVMSFVAPLALGTARANFKKLDAYTVTRNGAAKKLATRPFDPQTSQVSEVSFDPSGESAAVASVRYVVDGKPESKVIMLQNKRFVDKPDENYVMDQKQINAKAYRNQHVVTAVAFAEMPTTAPSGATTLITGRFDGSVFCGDKRIENFDRSPVTHLRVAGQGPWFVALHASNKIVVGNCGNSYASPQIIEEELTSPQSLILRSVANESPGGVASSPAKSDLQLSFTDERVLYRITWSAHSKPKDISTKKRVTKYSKFDQAVPIFATSGDRVGDFLTLPNRNWPWVGNLKGVSPSDNGGMPVGLPPQTTKNGQKAVNGRVAMSPNRQHYARITVKEKGQAERRLTDNTYEVVGVGGEEPLAVTLNDSGVLTILERGGKIALVKFGETKAVRGNLDFDGQCLKLTPDGQNALVAGLKGQVAVIKLNVGVNDTTATIAATQNAQHISYGAPVTACAIGNRKSIVLGFKDGKVLYLPSSVGKPLELSVLAPFRLRTEVLDVSIDTAERFVAALGKRVENLCLGGESGYPVRIWDLSQPRQTFPVASWCLPQANVLAIGPIWNNSGKWVLPVYLDSGSSIQKIEYKCLACTGIEAKYSESLIKDAKEKFEPRELNMEQIRNLYGIEQ